jgi:GxGYxY sequence motif in domain of unknown function N-terminal/GxGYxYP putative glycoside hydrolase C-terminal domain
VTLKRLGVIPLALLTLAISAAAAFAPGCSTSSSSPPASGNDAAPAPATDSGASQDAAAADSSSGQTDGSQGTEDSSLPEASVDGGPSTGIAWPDGGSFPIFAQATALDVADVANVAETDGGGNSDLKTMLTTLEGLVNRTTPRIWLMDSASDSQEGPSFWLDQSHIPENVVSDPMTLVTKYATEIAGIVIYDPNVLDTINLAVTIAGLKGGIVASPDVASTLTAAPYNLTTIEDVRTLGLTTTIDVYTYELSTYGSQTSPRLIIGHDPTSAGLSDCLIDYAIATQAAVVWLDSTQADQLTLLGSFLSNLEPNAPYLGWWVDEPSGVSAAGQHQVPVFAADWSRNLTALGGVHQTVTPPTPPPAPALDVTKAYVAIFMSDGDNLQENERLIPLKWRDTARGSVPISWTVQPALVDVAPVILNYYYSTATPNDVLVSGPSGLGYTYPQEWPQSPSDSFAAYTIRSASYLQRAGLNVITVWDNGTFLGGVEPQANNYATNMPFLLGLTEQEGNSAAPTLLGSSLPILPFAVTYAGTEEELESGITAQIQGENWNSSTGHALFITVQGDMNDSTITPTAFYDVQQYFAPGSANADPDIVFVRGDQLFQLARESLNLTTTP